MGIFFIPVEIKDTSLEPNMHNKAIYSILSHTGDKNYMQGYVLEALYHNCENHGPWVTLGSYPRVGPTLLYSENVLNITISIYI